MSIGQNETANILAIDDEITNLDIINEIFEETSFDIKTASSGEEGLEILKDYKPDIILLDIMMPGTDGYQMCKMIKKDKTLAKCKVILLSGKALAEERIKGYENGADDYVVKPFINEELEAKVNVFSRLVQTEKDLLKDKESLEGQLSTHTESLIQSEKMASLGQLAAGVAHEINNPVGFVTSNLGTLREYIDVFKTVINKYENFSNRAKDKIDQEAQKLLIEIDEIKKKEDLNFLYTDIDELLEQSIEGMHRVKEIVQGLKSFARVDEAEIKEADINELIEQSLKLVWNELKYKCQIQKELGKLPTIQCFPNQLSQVFMNLLVNAAHAIETNGEIIIKSFLENGNVIVKITDNGKGIPKENLDQLFNPFFTTKPVGKGTGLGLSISYGIVEKHKGAIEVTSEVGKGTTFSIKIPEKSQIEN